MAGSSFTGPLKIKKSDGTKVTFVDKDGILQGDAALDAGSIGTNELADNALSADASGRAKMATNFFDNATLANKLNGAAIDESMVENSDGTGGEYIMKYATVLYDFSVDGGAQGTITLAETASIPDNAIVDLLYVDVLTTFTSATDAATIKLDLPADGSLTTAIAISDATNPWDAGIKPASTYTAIGKKTTAVRAPELTVAGGEDLTAGKAVFMMRYWVSE